jgi:AraC-like DNA-binding protein
MSSQAAAANTSLSLFAPPYLRFEPLAMGPFGDVTTWRGSAIIWRLQDGIAQQQQFDWLRDRPFGLPLIILLPRPDEIGRTLPLLTQIRSLQPRGVVPEGALGSPERAKQLLASPPRNFADGLTSYLTARGMLRSRRLHSEIHRILELSSEVQSITVLSRRMYTSRRTLGRHFSAEGVPVPSHWLQFGRLLHVCLQLQTDQSAIFRIAHRAKYPDGFTMSNQMKRVIGVRPSDIRQMVGWEWIVESWLARESVRNESGLA